MGCCVMKPSQVGICVEDVNFKPICCTCTNCKAGLAGVSGFICSCCCRCCKAAFAGWYGDCFVLFTCAGCKTGLAGMVTACVVGLVLLVLTPVFEKLPLNVMGAIVISGVSGLFEYEQAVHLFKVRLGADSVNTPGS